MRRGERALRAGEHGGGREQLRAVGLELVGTRRERGAVEADEPGSPSTSASAPARSAGARCPRRRAARARSTTPSSCAAVGSPGARGTVVQDEQRVAGRRLARGHDRARRHAGLGGEQRDERLVLDRLHAREPQPRAGALVPERAPELRQQLAVVGVAAVDLDEQRPSGRVLGPRDEGAGRLARGRLDACTAMPSSARSVRTSSGSGRPAEVPATASRSRRRPRRRRSRPGRRREWPPRRRPHR